MLISLMELAYTIIPLFLSVLLGHVSSARFLILVTGQGMVEEEIGRSDHRPPHVNMNFLPSMELMARQLANIRSLPRGKREETCLHEFLARNFKRRIKKRDSSLGIRNDFIIRYIISKENDKSLESVDDQQHRMEKIYLRFGGRKNERCWLDE